MFISLRFIYSEKATIFFEISILDLSYVVTVKSTVEILQNFVAFSEYMNFNMTYQKWTFQNCKKKAFWKVNVIAFKSYKKG